MARQSKLTPEKTAAFALVLAETGQVKKAAEAIGMSRYAVYKWRKDHPDFAEAWDEAAKVSVYTLEDEAMRRAVDGVAEPVYYKGERIDTIAKYSDTLLIFLLKGLAPEKYRDNLRAELTGEDGGPIRTEDTTARAARVAQLLALAAQRKSSASEQPKE